MQILLSAMLSMNNYLTMNFSDWIKLIKENVWYLITSILGTVLVAIGGICWNMLLGKIMFIIGMSIAIVALVLGLRNKGIEWEHFD